MIDKNWVRIRFTCSQCGKESWTEFRQKTYVLSVKDLICDDCFQEEED